MSDARPPAYILIVDDDAEAAEPVARLLRRGGHRVAVIHNGREALALLASAVPDLIVLDVRMPQMDGVEVLRVLRSYLRWQAVPVILLTAYADQQQVRDAAGQYDATVVSKAGIDLPAFAALVEERIGNRPARD